MSIEQLLVKINEYVSQFAFLNVNIDPLEFVASILKIIVIIFLIKFLVSLGNRFIAGIFTPKGELKIKIEERQAQTLSALLKSILRYALYFLGALMVLPIFGVRTESLLASAGILGLALSFGAQNLVRDVITGFFLLFEDQFSVGEYVEASGVGGIVEETGLRVTKIRDFGGQLHIIPNGLIQQVTNYNRGTLRALVEVGIAYEEHIDHAIQVIEQVNQKLKEEREDIVDGPTVYGVTNLGASEVVIRVVARTVPMSKWAIEAELRKRIKDAFDREGIEIPYPRKVMITQLRNDKELAEETK